MIRNRFRVLVLTLGVIGTLLFSVSPASAAPHQNANLYVNWNFGSVGGFWNVDQVMWVVQKAPSTFWAMNWTWQDDPSTGGYIGLQTNGNRFDGSSGEMAIFSLWGSNAYSGPSCGKFAWESGGTGYSCRLPITIYNSNEYKYRIWRLNADSGGQWWGGWLINVANGAETYIGALRVPTAHNLMRPPMNFTEYFGTAVACNQVPVSIVNWTQPAANSGGGVSYQYGSTYSSWSKGSCTGGSVTPTDYGWTKGAFVRMGG
jgi:hypothetical protein